MLGRISDKRRFSWLIFAICMLEVVLWAAPPVSALTLSESSFTTGELYRNHIIKEKDHYTHANGIKQQQEESSAREAAIERMLDNELQVRTC
jgi:hypothetical protein